MANNLRDRKVILKLSDPWDLGEQINWQAIEAVILDVKDNGDAPISIAIKLTVPFKYQNTHCEFFIASPRHEGNNFNQLNKGKAVFCGLTRVSFDQIISDNPFDLKHWRGGIGLIGEIELL